MTTAYTVNLSGFVDMEPLRPAMQNVNQLIFVQNVITMKKQINFLKGVL